MASSRTQRHGTPSVTTEPDEESEPDVEVETAIHVAADADADADVVTDEASTADHDEADQDEADQDEDSSPATDASDDRDSSADETTDVSALVPTSFSAPMTLEDNPASRIGHGKVCGAVRYVLNRYELRGDQPLPQSIAVVSALRGEGVTTLSRALAEVLAVDFAGRVCWIDLTWTAAPRRRRNEAPAVATPGIYEVLTGAAELEKVIIDGGHPNLWMLGGGDVSAEHRSAMARWHELERLFDHLRAEFDFLVLDTSPVLADPDALAVMRHADAQILVARHAAVSAGQIRSVTSDLNSVPMLGAVLNEYRTHTPRMIRRFFAG